jgi:hypothetical protein
MRGNNNKTPPKSLQCHGATPIANAARYPALEIDLFENCSSLGER